LISNNIKQLHNIRSSTEILQYFNLSFNLHHVGENKVNLKSTGWVHKPGISKNKKKKKERDGYRVYKMTCTKKTSLWVIIQGHHEATGISYHSKNISRLLWVIIQGHHEATKRLANKVWKLRKCKAIS
jgi:hypothetical protein